MKRCSSRPITLLLMGSATLACAGQGDTAPPVTTRDSTGIRIVENITHPTDIPQWTVVAEPRLSLGTVEGDPAEEFSRITSAIRLSDGAIVVADGGALELRLFDSSGTHRWSAGGQGGGPGEYRGMGQLLLLAADSILVHDRFQNRLSLYLPDGTLVRSWQIPLLGPFNAPPPIGRLNSGDYVAYTVQSDVYPPNGLVSYTSMLVRYSAGGEIADTVATSPGGQGYYDWCAPGSQSMCNYYLPFARTGSAAAADDRLYLGNGETYEIRVFAPDGRPTALWRWNMPARSVTSQDIRLDKEFRLQSARDDNGRRQIERWYEEMPVLETMPFFSRFILDAAHNLWVEDYRPRFESGRSYTVFDSTGSITARVELPVGFDLMDIGRDYVLGVVRDENDVEFVRLHELEKASS